MEGHPGRNLVRVGRRWSGVPLDHQFQSSLGYLA
jgi:hypothetical protein